MAKPVPLAAQMGLAYVVGAHGVLRDASKRFACPEAQVLTVLGLHSVNESGVMWASTKELHQVVQLSLPLLRSYVRALVKRGYVQKVRLFHLHRAALVLQLTYEGEQLARYCQRELRRAAERVVDWRLHQQAGT